MKFCNNNNDVPKKTDDQQLLQLFVIVLKARLNALPFLELAGNIERLKDVFATCASPLAPSHAYRQDVVPSIATTCPATEPEMQLPDQLRECVVLCPAKRLAFHSTKSLTTVLPFVQSVKFFKATVGHPCFQLQILM